MLPVALTLSLAAWLATVQGTVHFERQSASDYPVALTKGPAPKQAWIDTYNSAKAAGKIPDVPASSLVDGNPQYPSGIDPGPNGACSWTLAHCFGPGDTYDAPSGSWGLSFDDGPTQDSPQLYSFLAAQNLSATHFLIGSAILGEPDVFASMDPKAQHLAVHTWSHPYMTTLSDMGVLGELGWTSQIISDQTGITPAYWRPPYGDVDARVRAIAWEVFGLRTTGWNQDTFDWCLNEGGGSSCSGEGEPSDDSDLDAELSALYTQKTKTPGIIVLEHELTKRSIGGFMRALPNIISNGWKVNNIPDMWQGSPWYQISGTPVGGGAPRLAVASNSSVSVTSSSTVPSTSVATTLAVVSTTSTGTTSSSPTSTLASVVNAQVPVSTASLSLTTAPPRKASGAASVYVSLPLAAFVGACLVAVL